MAGRFTVLAALASGAFALPQAVSSAAASAAVGASSLASAASSAVATGTGSAAPAAGSSSPAISVPAATVAPGAHTTQSSAATAANSSATYESYVSYPADITSALGYNESPPPDVAVTNVTSHGPYTGPAATTTGALTNSVLASSITPLPAAPSAYTYNSTGELNDPEPAPYTPAGGLGTNGTLPVYNAKSDYDFESLSLALYQEWIELDLFNYGVAQYSEADFLRAGLTADDRALLSFMADQELGHATVLTNILGAAAPKQCTYNYPVTNIREFVDFNQKLTRFGESGVYGFLNHLDSREAAQLLTQSITTEARQQMIFRQFAGLFPMPVWFEVGVPQSWAWTLLAPYISSCPEGQTRLAWQNFPALSVLNQPNINLINANQTTMIYNTIGNSSAAPSNSTVPASESCLFATEGLDGYNCAPAISRNRSIPLSFPGRQVFFEWENPGQLVGPNNSYITTRGDLADEPRYVAWASQLNLTYSPLVTTGPNTGYTYQPDMSTYAGDPAINGTMFVAITSTDTFLTPFNLSSINYNMFAGPAIYQAG